MTLPSRCGTLHGVGVGPGDPGLLTVKALDVIRRVPVIAYPAPPQGDSMARGIVAGYLPGGQIEIPLRMAFTSDRVSANAAYDAGAAAIAWHLVEGRDVAVLCEGDPFFFGSFMYLFARLSQQYPVEVVPGVTSVSACSAALRVPLAALDDRVAVIPATSDEAGMEALLVSCDAAAILKAGHHLPKIVRLLDRLGLADRASYIEYAGMASQRIRPLAEAAREGGPYFSMVLVHKRGDKP
ncbi:MAG: precorrin-2 C(20)-methyltransferase [Alphaproteobacteria bacterium]|nr:precorrin-2 C(20)-methyltransferase [Alphaproteobacteria bacterium]